MAASRTRSRRTPVQIEFDKANSAALVAGLRAWDATESSSPYASRLHKEAYEAHLRAAAAADRAGYHELAQVRRESAARHLPWTK